MLLIHGTYRLAPKLVAYRNDWCNHCDKPVLAQQWRCFYLAHFFWIPCLPLGFYKDWRCEACTKNPRDRVRAATGIIVSGLLVFSLIFGVSLFGPNRGEEASVVWGTRFVFGSLAAVFAFWLRSRLTELPAATKRVEPLRNDRCLVCGGRVTDYPKWHCVDCKIVRYGD
jgi:hypothetical protein